jgi:glycerol-3-phosphate dehydrogenase subunit B
MSRHDVVVIGAGVAGLTAAVRLAEAGASVLVLAKGVGATHLSPGTIDVLGYDPDPVARPLEALRALTAARPEHPYNLVGAEGVAEAVEWFKGRFPDGPLAPYAFVGDPAENVRLPTAVGVLKPTAVVPETMAGGDLRDGGAVCVVGFRALKDFHPMLLADNLGRHEGIEARGIELDLRPEGRVDANSLAFGRAFDDPAFRSAVVAQIAARLRAGERVALPAVLGVRDPHAVWTEMEDKLGRPVFEVPTLPPSVPGMRIFATLRERLRRAGGKIIMNAVVTEADHDGTRLTAVSARIGLRSALHAAERFVLATGGIADGGIELDSHWVGRETALGLPVTGVPEPGAERFRPAYFDDHPMARAGVAADAAQRPVDTAGQRVLDNVLVAGATLAGAEPWREKSGDGLSLSTGFRAAGLILDETGATAQAPAATTGG